MYRVEYTSRVATTHVRGDGQTIVTCVTVMNGSAPNFSFDQYRKSSAPSSGADRWSRRCAARPGASASSDGSEARMPLNSSAGLIDVDSSSYDARRPGPPATYAVT